MKGYFIEVTQVSNSLNDWYPRGYQESYIRKGALAAKAEDFFKDPAFWSNYLLYTSRERAERYMKFMQKNTHEKYWDSSFRIGEIEVNDCGHVTCRMRDPIMNYNSGIVQSHWYK